MNIRVGTTILALGLICTGGALAQELPPHPRDIKYRDLDFSPPKPADHRIVLKNGLRCYLVPDDKVPAIRIQAWIDAGEVYVPKAKRGLAKLTGDLMRSGGIEGLEARKLDARLDAIAAEVETGFDAAHGQASLWTLKAHADEALELFAKVLTKPVFADDRIRRAKDELKEQIAHRDDEPQPVLDHEVLKLVYGADSPIAQRESVATVDAITRAEIVNWHATNVTPGNIILAVSGDFERGAMQAKLEALFAGFEQPRTLVAEKRELPKMPAEAHAGVFVLDRPLTQGNVEMVELGIQMGDPDEVPLHVMNYILGGGSFTSYITKAVRNDNGLAYTADSFVHPGVKWPGLAGVFFQSQAEATAFATKLCAEQIRRIQTQPAAPDELARARDAILGRFPERFSTAHGTAAALAENEFDGRPKDWLESYRAKVAAVTAEDVMRVAKAHFVLEKMAVVCIGPAKVVEAKDDKNKAAIADLGKIEALAEEQ